MNLRLLRSMPLAQAITGVPARSCGADDARGRAQLLRRHRQQDRVVAADLGAHRGDADALVEPHSRQPRALAPVHQRIGAGAIAGGEHDRPAGARDHVGERDAPGAGSDDGDMVERHGGGGSCGGGSCASVRGSDGGVADSAPPWAGPSRR